MNDPRIISELLEMINIAFLPSVRKFKDEKRKKRKINTESTQPEIKNRMPMN